MPANPAHSIVTIQANGRPCGVGFLVGERQVLTCAHVVNIALGRDASAGERPDSDNVVQLEFSLIGDPPHPLRPARVVLWKPPPSPRTGPKPTRLYDIAGLEIPVTDPPPGNAEVVRLGVPGEGVPVKIFGYPHDPPSPDGGWVTGELVRRVRSQLYQINGAYGEPFQVQPGFSGSPVIDGSNRVIGMIALARRTGDQRDSRAISPTWLHDAWPEVVAVPEDGRAPDAPPAPPASPARPARPVPRHRPQAMRAEPPLDPTREPRHEKRHERREPDDGSRWRGRWRASQSLRTVAIGAVSGLAVIGLFLGGRYIVGVLQPGPDSCVPLEVSVSTEKDELLADLAERYNEADRRFGDDQCAKVSVHGLTSGTAMEALAGGWKVNPATGDSLPPRPQVWLPTSSMWLGLLGARNQGDLLSDPHPRSITTSVLGFAMPKRMADALRSRNGGNIGWQDVFHLATDPDGWGSVGHPEWGRFALGRDNPHFSTSGLAATVATYYAATHKSGNLTENDLSRGDVVKFVHGIESSVAQYGDEATLFVQKLYEEDQKRQPVPFVSAVVMQEQLAYLYDIGAPTGDVADRGPRPIDPMVMIYPSDGTLMMDHPYAVLAGATGEQRAAAENFRAFLTEEGQQKEFRAHGFRTLAAPEQPTRELEQTLGAPKDQRLPLVSPPAANLIAKMQANWDANRKKARVLLVLDVSGSMGELIDPKKATGSTKMGQLKPAARRGVRLLGNDDEAGIWTFSKNPDFTERVPISSIRRAGARLDDVINGLTPKGDTALYATMRAAHKEMVDNVDRDRINAIVLLTDGRNTPPNARERAALLDLYDAANADDSIRVFTISYGSDADKELLQQLADRSKGSYYDASNPRNIEKVFASVFSNFVGSGGAP